MITLRCDQCGKDFQRRAALLKWRARPKKFCSRECWRESEVFKTPEQQYWTFVEKTDGCWKWKGSKNKFGYGAFRFHKRMMMAHRVSWEIHNGPILQGIQVLHKCDNPECSRPDHLFLGNQSENMVDCVEKGRKNTAKGERHAKAILREEDVLQIRSLCQSGLQSRHEIARSFNVSYASITDIVLRRSWRHLP